MAQKAHDKIYTKSNELERLVEVQKIKEFLVDFDPQLDGFTKLSQNICQTNNSYLSLIEEKQQTVISSQGYQLKKIPREDTFCNHTIHESKILIIEDTLCDERFKDNPFVQESPYLRFYAGVPLKSKNGYAIGTLCVLDEVPQKLSAQQIEALVFLAEQIMVYFEKTECLNLLKKVEEKASLKKVKLQQREVELKNAQVELQDYQRYQTAILQNVPSMIYVKDAHKNMAYSFINKAGEVMLGLAAEQIIGKQDSELYSSALSEKIAEQEAQIFEERKVFRVVKEEVDCDGKKKFFTTFKVPTYDENNEPHLLIGISRDISDEVLAKAELEKERTKTFHNAKLASLGEIAAGVAHEINNPLAIISSSLHLLQKFKNNPEKFDLKINSIMRSVSRITKIINGLKKFSRTDTEAVFLLKPLNEIIAEAILMVEMKAKQQSIVIELNLQSEQFILCNEIEIEQVIINLVNNAIDAIKNFPVKWIKLNLFEKDQNLVLQVIDSGVGISSEVEAKLFEPFFTTKPIGEGTGLGLSISKGIIDHHQAQITLNRQVQNTCFEIKFPIAQVGARVA